MPVCDCRAARHCGRLSGSGSPVVALPLSHPRPIGLLAGALRWAPVGLESSGQLLIAARTCWPISTVLRACPMPHLLTFYGGRAEMHSPGCARDLDLRRYCCHRRVVPGDAGLEIRTDQIEGDARRSVVRRKYFRHGARNATAGSRIFRMVGSRHGAARAASQGSRTTSKIYAASPSCAGCERRQRGKAKDGYGSLCRALHSDPLQPPARASRATAKCPNLTVA